MRPGLEIMQPGMDATFLKTTAAKKISTSEFRGPEFADIPGCQSLRYDSIVALPRQEGPSGPGYDSIVTLPRTSFQEDTATVSRQHRIIAEVQPHDSPANRISSQTVSLNVHQTPSMASYQTLSMGGQQTPSYQMQNLGNQTPQSVITNQQKLSLSVSGHPAPQPRKHPDQESQHPDNRFPPGSDSSIAGLTSDFEQQSLQSSPYHPQQMQTFQTFQQPPPVFQLQPQEFPWGHHQQVRINMQPPSQGYQSTRKLSQVDRRQSPQQAPTTPETSKPPIYHPPPPPGPHMQQYPQTPPPPNQQQGQRQQQQNMAKEEIKVIHFGVV